VDVAAAHVQKGQGVGDLGQRRGLANHFSSACYLRQAVSVLDVHERVRGGQGGQALLQSQGRRLR